MLIAVPAGLLRDCPQSRLGGDHHQTGHRRMVLIAGRPVLTPRQRKAAGFTPVDRSCLRFKRRIYRPFERAGDPPSALHPKEEEHNPPVAG